MKEKLLKLLLLDPNLVEKQRIRIYSFIGFIFFPTYYYIWTYLNVGGYENLSLRLILCALCLLVFIDSYKSFIPKKYFVFIIFCFYTTILPVFFNYMLLQNDNLIWHMSALASIMYLFIILEVASAFIIYFVGITLVMIFFLITGDVDKIVETFSTDILALYFFFFSGLVVLSINRERQITRKLQSVKLVAGNIAHEVRTPLSAIQVEGQYLKLLMSKAEDEPELMTESIDRIMAHVKSANNVVNLLLSHVTFSDKNKYPRMILDVGKVIEEAISNTFLTDKEKQKISLNVKNNFEINTNEVLFQHVIINLIKNALRAIHEEGRGEITVKIYLRKGKKTIEVKDTVGGIDDNHLPFIFTPFFSVTKTTKGNGIGLAFCKEFITSQKGQIICLTKRGEKTTFRITMP